MASIIKGLSSKEKDSIMIILTEDDPMLETSLGN
jgi:hypothetical protein